MTAGGGAGRRRDAGRGSGCADRQLRAEPSARPTRRPAARSPARTQGAAGAVRGGAGVHAAALGAARRREPRGDQARPGAAGRSGTRPPGEQSARPAPRAPRAPRPAPPARGPAGLRGLRAQWVCPGRSARGPRHGRAGLPPSLPSPPGSGSALAPVLTPPDLGTGDLGRPRPGWEGDPRVHALFVHPRPLLWLRPLRPRVGIPNLGPRPRGVLFCKAWGPRDCTS
jgi:hypothetical protein